MVESVRVVLRNDNPTRSLVKDEQTGQLFWLNKQVNQETSVNVSFGAFEVDPSRLELVGHVNELVPLIHQAAVPMDVAVDALLYEGVIDPETPAHVVRDALLRRGVVVVAVANHENTIEPPVQSVVKQKKSKEEVLSD